MLQWLAPALAGALGVLELARRYQARASYYRQTWRLLLLQALVNAAASAGVVALLDSDSKLSHTAVFFVAGMGGPAILRARLIDWQKRTIKVAPEESTTAGAGSRGVGPAALYEWFLDLLDQALWSDLLNWRRAYVDDIVPKLRAAGHDASSVAVDLEQFIAGLQYDEVRKDAALKVIRLRANEPEPLEGVVRVAIEQLPGAYRRLDSLLKRPRRP